MKIVLDTHAHTIVSGHAYNTIREMAQMAKEKGLEAFALTEHAPQMPGTCHEFYFQNLHIVPREMYGVRLFMGVELNIMNEKGEVDLPESTLCQMDIAIASIHGPCYKGERTEEAITAATQPVPTPRRRMPSSVSAPRESLPTAVMMSASPPALTKCAAKLSGAPPRHFLSG